MISDVILIPQKYARLQEIASNFAKFSGGGPETPAGARTSSLVRSFATLPGPPFQNSWIRPCLPIPKAKHGDLDIYRRITLTPAISRLFGSVLLAKYGNVLHSDCLQYGFKKDSSCSHACLILRNRFVFITNEVAKYIVHC